MANPVATATNAGAPAKQYPNRQIKVFKTSDALIEVVSLLSTNPDKNKIQVLIKSYKEGQPKVDLTAYVDPDTMKVLMSEILNGTFLTTFGPTGYTEYKGTPAGRSKRPDGKAESRIFSVVYQPTMKNYKTNAEEPSRYPYVFKMQVGEGQEVGEGAIKMVKKETELSFKMSLMDAKKLAIDVLDYIRDFESKNRVFG